MKRMRRLSRDAKAVGRSLAVAASNSRAGSRLAAASGHVIAERLARGTMRMLGSGTPDHAENARMVSEKAKVLAEVGMISSSRSVDVAGRLARYSANEFAVAMRAGAAMAASRGPVHLAAAQYTYSMGWFARAMSQYVALTGLAMQSRGAAMRPVHRTVSANVRRLGRSG